MSDPTGRRAGAAPSQLALDLPHRPSLARDDLIVTDANRLAVAAVDAWPNWPHPVLVIVGPPGAGKSHLAAAWAETAGAERLGAQGAPAPGAGPFAMVVDDVDRSGPGDGAVFAVVNAARLGGGFVLLTARRRPSAIVPMLPDLASRLRAATVAELGAPDDALLEGVLAKLFADRQMTVAPRIVRYAVLRMERSLEAASRLVAALDREALAGREKMSRGLVARILSRPEFGGNVRPAAKPADLGAEIGHKGQENAADRRDPET